LPVIAESPQLAMGLEHSASRPWAVAAGTGRRPGAETPIAARRAPGGRLGRAVFHRLLSGRVLAVISVVAVFLMCARAWIVGGEVKRGARYRRLRPTSSWSMPAKP
jgi:hypothetical protein